MQTFYEYTMLGLLFALCVVVFIGIRKGVLNSLVMPEINNECENQDEEHPNTSNEKTFDVSKLARVTNKVGNNDENFN